MKGADQIYDRPAFAEMLDQLLSDGVKTVLVESAHRFARDLIVQETGYRYLQDKGITLIPVDAPTHFSESSPTADLIRQVLGAVAQYQKAELVAKLKGARVRKLGHAGGWNMAPEAARSLVKDLHDQGASLRNIASELAQRGFLSPSGKPYGAESIKRMMG